MNKAVCMHTPHTAATLVFALLLLLAPQISAGATPPSAQALIDSGHLQISSDITPESGAVPGQKMQLHIQVATDRWFSGGTRITAPEVPGLVILQTEQFANNASENRHGQSWVVQRWTLDVYPQQAGSFSLGPVALAVSVNTEQGTVKGKVQAPAVQFEVNLPKALEQLPHWVAAPEFSVTQRFDHSLQGLEVGDAIEQSIHLEASDVLAMMLPPYPAPSFEGIASYPAPPKLQNRSNRGQSVAMRTETISYVLQQGGHYQLPAREFYWWNTQTRQLSVIELEAVDFEVGGDAGAVQTQATTEKDSKYSVKLIAFALLFALIAAVLCLAVITLLRKLPRQRLAQWLRHCADSMAQLRKPALPARLNPVSTQPRK